MKKSSAKKKEKKPQKTVKTMAQLEKYVEKRNIELPCTSFNKDAIEIEHMDGSKFLFTRFLTEKITYSDGKNFNEEILVIYAEHHTPAVYFLSALKKKPIIIKNFGSTFQREKTRDHDLKKVARNIPEIKTLLKNHLSLKKKGHSDEFLNGYLEAASDMVNFIKQER